MQIFLRANLVLRSPDGVTWRGDGWECHSLSSPTRGKDRRWDRNSHSDGQKALWFLWLKIEANNGEPASANNSIQEEILQMQLGHNQLATSLSMTMEISDCNRRIKKTAHTLLLQQKNKENSSQTTTGRISPGPCSESAICSPV